MFSVKFLAMSTALLASATVMVGPDPAQAGVVVKSSGPSAGKFPVGKKLDDAGQIVLAAGDSVTVLSNGSTRVIRGAGNHRVGARGGSRRMAFRRLTQQRAASRPRVGAARSGSASMSTTNPNLWWVNVSKSGTMCVSNLDSVRMWRPEQEGAPTYVFENASSADRINVGFPDGEMVTDWDFTRMPLSEGASYMITGPENADSSQAKGVNQITFTIIDTPPEAPEELAQLLIERDCMAQLEVLTEAMR